MKTAAKAALRGKDAVQRLRTTRIWLIAKLLRPTARTFIDHQNNNQDMPEVSVSKLGFV
jgi:hypothetical protein